MSKQRRRMLYLLIIFFALLSIVFIQLSTNYKRSTSRGVEPSSLSPRTTIEHAAPIRAHYPFPISADMEPKYYPVSEFRVRSFAAAAENGVVVRVFSADRMPIPDATIRVYRTCDRYGDSFTDLITQSLTDTSGSSRIALDDAVKSCVIVVTKIGYNLLYSLADLQGDGLIERNFVLNQTPASIQGHVLDSQGQPIPGAVVITYALWLDRETSHEGRFSSSTDKLGWYKISSLPEGYIQLRAKAEGYKEQSVAAFDVNRDRTVTVDFRLEKAYAAETTLRVIDAQGRPIEGAVISSEQIGQAFPSNERGIISVKVYSRTPAVTPICTIAADGYATRSVDIDPKLAQNEVILNRQRVLMGRIITADGQPISNARISDAFTRSEYGRTDDQGGFALRIGDDRRILIKASADGYVEKRVQVGEREQDLTITLDPLNVRGGIYGRVLDSQGIPAWKFFINTIPINTISSENQDSFESRFVENIDGIFALTDLPEGLFMLDFFFRAQGETSFMGKTGSVMIKRGQVFGPVTIVCYRPGK